MSSLWRCTVVTREMIKWGHSVLALQFELTGEVLAAGGWLMIRVLDWSVIYMLRSAWAALAAALVLWVGGFDVLYACQDFEHDRRVGLNSVPQAFGMVSAFWIARAMHVGMLIMLCWLVVLFGLGKVAMLGVAVVAVLLLYEHWIISPKD